MKPMKLFYELKTCIQLSREITALRHLPEHPNIVRLYWDNSERLRKDKHIVSAFEYEISEALLILSSPVIVFEFMILMFSNIIRSTQVRPWTRAISSAQRIASTVR
jgi:serine/threonine protein kinase